MKLLTTGLGVLVTVAAAQATEPVSIIGLLASPGRFNKKEVSVGGVAREYPDESERWILYLDCESAAAENLSNGLVFRLDGSPLPKGIKNFSMKYVLVYGTFRLGGPHGPRGVGGSIDQVTDVAVYPLLRDEGEEDITCRTLSTAK